ncbi:MAG: hypothetical protein WCL39_14455 [Armatimonadota bacterium]
MNTLRTKQAVSLTVLAVLGSVILAPVASIASESGKKNTTLALGAATIFMATQKNKTGAIVGAVATAIAYSQYSKEKNENKDDWHYGRNDRDNYDNRGYQQSTSRNNTYYGGTRYREPVRDNDSQYEKNRDANRDRNDNHAYNDNYRNGNAYGNYQERSKDSSGNRMSNGNNDRDRNDKDDKRDDRDTRDRKQPVRNDGYGPRTASNRDR